MSEDLFKDLVTGLKEVADYAQGKAPALVSRYEDGKLISRRWQTADGKEAPGHDIESRVESMVAGTAGEGPQTGNGSV